MPSIDYMYSFCNRINHICRTTDPYLLKDLINKFQDLKYKLLLISTNQPSIPSLHFKQASLPINMGGL